MANQIVAVAGTLGMIAVVLNWVGACDPLFAGAAKSAMGDQPPDPAAMRKQILAEKAAKRGEKPPPPKKGNKAAPEPAPTYRAPGAFYPDQHLQEDPGFSIDPLMIAVVGGAMIFGLAGAGTFVMMGGLGGREEKPEGEPPKDEIV